MIMKNTLMLILLFIVVLVFLCFISDNLSAQGAKRDSIKQDSMAYINNIRSIAGSDGRKQQLSPTQIKLFLVYKKKFRADLFNPQINFVSNTTLLTDSNYLKAFREGAYQRALDDMAIIPRCIWGAFGPGIDNISSKNFNTAISGSLELSKKQLVSVDVRGNWAVLAGTSTTAVSFLYGGIIKQHSSFLTISTGVSIINVNQSYFNLFAAPTPSTSTTDLGLPIIVQGYFVVGQHVGFGVSAYFILILSFRFCVF
jgi:hypothetical protein